MIIVGLISIGITIFNRSDNDHNVSLSRHVGDLKVGLVTDGVDRLVGTYEEYMVYQTLDVVTVYSLFGQQIINQIDGIADSWLLGDGRVVANLISGGSVMIKEGVVSKSDREVIVLSGTMFYRVYADLDNEDYGYLVNLYFEDGRLFLDGILTDEHGKPQLLLTKFKNGYIYTTDNVQADYFYWHILDSEFREVDDIEADFVRDQKLIKGVGLLVDIGNVYYKLDQDYNLVRFDWPNKDLDFESFFENLYLDTSKDNSGIYNFSSDNPVTTRMELTLASGLVLSDITDVKEYQEGYLYLAKGAVWYTR